MDFSPAVIGVYLVWVLLAVFYRGVVKLSFRILQDIVVLTFCSVLLPLLLGEGVTGVVLTLVAIVLYQDLPSPWIRPDSRAVLITGCDTGFGYATALYLDKLGFRVFAGCLDVGGEGEQKLVKEASQNLATFALDVTDVQQVQAGAKFVADKLQGQVLHGVVNNAGILMVGSVETMAESDIKKILEVNLMGVINVHRAFMPLLRQPRQTAARQITIASNVGLAPSALMGIYGASKSAVALLNETWRYELKPLNIYVSTIVPSGFKTGILMYNREAVGNRWWQQASKEVRDFYGRACFIISNKRSNYKDYLNADFSLISRCIADALLSTHPKAFYYKGLMARSLPFLYLHLPSWLWDRIMPRYSDFYNFPVQALAREHRQD